MFEFSIVRKYLLPRRRQLSVSLISLMSVGVISLVVWLVLVFLSVTSGIEENWLNKLTSVSSPLRITPTEEYYRSYYAQVDALSHQSNYSSKTIGEKRFSTVSDPFDPMIDRELPPLFPAKDLDRYGNLKDPVTLLFSALDEMKTNVPSLSFGDYEMSGALMKINIKRYSPSPYATTITQASYLLSPATENPYLAKLLAPQRDLDVQNLFAQSLRGTLEQNQWSFITPKQWKLPNALWPNEGTLSGKMADENKRFIATNNGPETLCFQLGKAVWKGKEISAISVEDTATFCVDEQKFEGTQIHSTLQSLPLQGTLSENELSSLVANLCNTPSRAWAVAEDHQLRFPKMRRAFPVLAPISLQNHGVAVGDSGQLVYSALSATSLQEQRLPISIAGFYDPGVLPTGNKCLIVPPEVIRTINSASPAMPVERELANGVGVWFSPIGNAKQIQKLLQEKLQAKEIQRYWKIETFHDYDIAKELIDQFASDRYLFSLVGVIILIVACCNVITLLLLLVNDKKKEMAILQAMGARKRSIALIFGSCGALMGMISASIGVSLAYFTLRHIDRVAYFLSFLQGREAFSTAFYGNALPDQLSGSAVMFVILSTTVISILAGLVPAVKACRLRPVEILRSS